MQRQADQPSSRPSLRDSVHGARHLGSTQLHLGAFWRNVLNAPTGSSLPLHQAHRHRKIQEVVPLKVLEQLGLTMKARSAKRRCTALRSQVSFVEDDPIFESIWDAILKGKDVSAGLFNGTSHDARAEHVCRPRSAVRKLGGPKQPCCLALSTREPEPRAVSEV